MSDVPTTWLPPIESFDFGVGAEFRISFRPNAVLEMNALAAPIPNEPDGALSAADGALRPGSVSPHRFNGVRCQSLLAGCVFLECHNDLLPMKSVGAAVFPKQRLILSIMSAVKSDARRE
jgi:hypothetical protein